MTYQMARPAGMNYGRASSVYNNVGQAQGARMTASANRRASAPKAARPNVSDAQRREQAARAAARRRFEAEMLYKMEQDRIRSQQRLERIKREEKAAKAAARRAARLEARREAEAFRRREIKVEKQRVPMGLILGIAIAFVLLLGVVYSFSQISESSATLSAMKTQLAEIEVETAKVKLIIEDKNDLGMIEKRATEELNMVKEGSVQKKYITISDGDRIVLENTVEEENKGFFGSMLSSVSATFEDLLDYFR